MTRTLLAKVTGGHAAMVVGTLTGVVVVGALSVPLLLTESQTDRRVDRPTPIAQVTPVPRSRLCPPDAGTCLGTKTADVDGNGVLDSLGLTFLNEKRYVLRAVLNGQGPTVTADVANFDYPQVAIKSLGWAGIGDIDGDGHDDLFFTIQQGANTATQTVRVWRDGAFRRPPGDFPRTFFDGGGAGSDATYGCRPGQFVVLGAVPADAGTVRTNAWTFSEVDYTLDQSGIWRAGPEKTSPSTEVDRYAGVKKTLRPCIRPGS